MASFSDNTCGGGLWRSTAKSYKNAITNELFIKLSAELHNRIRGDHDYLDQSVNTWTWFKASGMINSENLINDGLDNGTCASNEGETWSYNQGVILGGLNDLFDATHDRSYLTQARTLADSSSTSSHLNPNGVLTEPCEAGDCGSDGLRSRACTCATSASSTPRCSPATTGTTWHVRQRCRGIVIATPSTSTASTGPGRSFRSPQRPRLARWTPRSPHSGVATELIPTGQPKCRRTPVTTGVRRHSCCPVGGHRLEVYPSCS